MRQQLEHRPRQARRESTSPLFPGPGRRRPLPRPQRATLSRPAASAHNRNRAGHFGQRLRRATPCGEARRLISGEQRQTLPETPIETLGRMPPLLPYIPLRSSAGWRTGQVRRIPRELRTTSGGCLRQGTLPSGKTPSSSGRGSSEGGGVAAHNGLELRLE